MTVIDNSKIFLGGTFGDITVKVPANTTYAMGTVLGVDAEGNISAYSSENDKEGFVGEPSYILANDIINTSKQAEEYPLSRVLEEGDVNFAKLVFVNDADASDVRVRTALKNNGFTLCNVQELSL